MNWFLAFVGFFAILTEIFSLSWHNFRQYFNPSELYFVIETYEHAVELFPSIDLMNKIAIIWVTYDHEVDPYLKLYVEYVLELTKYLDSVHVIIKNPDNDASLLPKVMEILPDKNIFIIVEDADLRINLCSLFATLDYLSRPSPIIFHLNHETPWVESTMGVTPTGHYCSSYLLEDIYKKYLYVFRNYYSILYTSSSDYVPLLSKQMRKLRQYRNQHPLIKSSQRMNWCIFSGRIKYDHTRVVDSIFRSERLHFIHLISAATNPGNQKCVAYYNNDGVDGHQHSFNEYMDVLSQSVFTPCPAGNSPETFRHYEVYHLLYFFLIAHRLWN